MYLTGAPDRAELLVGRRWGVTRREKKDTIFTGYFHLSLWAGVSVMPVFFNFARTAGASLRSASSLRRPAAALSAGMSLQLRGTHEGIYNILWAVVFGFATLNILSLTAKRFEPNKRGMSFGEMMAVMVVMLSVFLLGWEMLNLFHIFPLKLRR